MINIRLAIIAVFIAIIISSIVGAYFFGKSSQKQSMLAAMKDSRISVLVDGKKIDEKIENSSDDELCAILGGC